MERGAMMESPEKVVDYGLNCGLAVDEPLSLSPSVTCSDMIDDDLADDLPKPDVLFGGVGMAYSF